MHTLICSLLLSFQSIVSALLQASNVSSSVMSMTQATHDIFTIKIAPSLIMLHNTASPTWKSFERGHSSENLSKRTQYLIIYISVSVAAGSIFVFLLLVFYFCRARRRKKRIPITDTVLSNTDGNPHSALMHFTAQQRVDPSTVEYSPLESRELAAPLLQKDIWEIPRRRLELGKKLGEGAFGFVFKAVLRTGDAPTETKHVAVKMVKENASSSERDNLLAELNIMKQLKPHPNVVSLVGAVRIEVNCPLVVVEFVPFGDLLGYLRKVRGVKDMCYYDPDNLPTRKLCSSQELMRFAIESAQGMEYLAMKKIVHRDLAARNVLVGVGKTCKITDFGMARDVRGSEIYTRTTRGLIPIKWTAIESVLRGIYTTKSDVWSFGILFFEILTVGGTPYPGMSGQQVGDFISQGKRIPKPMHVDNELYQVMMNCWESNPRKRPTFKQLVCTLKRLESRHEEYINLSQYNSCDYENIESFNDEKTTLVEGSDMAC